MAQRGGTASERAARAEVTRRQLVDAGRVVFARDGYDEVGVADIVEESGVGTRGAFYHHFAGKLDLFREVYADVERDLVLRAIASPPPGSTWDRLRNGLHDVVDAAAAPEIRRILFEDGRRVLGWAETRADRRGGSFAMIRDALVECADSGVIETDDPVALAHAVIAVVEESAMMTRSDRSRSTSARRARACLDQLLDAVSTPSGAASTAGPEVIPNPRSRRRAADKAPRG